MHTYTNTHTHTQIHTHKYTHLGGGNGGGAWKCAGSGHVRGHMFKDAVGLPG